MLEYIRKHANKNIYGVFLEIVPKYVLSIFAFKYNFVLGFINRFLGYFLMVLEVHHFLPFYLYGHKSHDLFGDLIGLFGF